MAYLKGDRKVAKGGNLHSLRTRSGQCFDEISSDVLRTDVQGRLDIAKEGNHHH